MIYMNEKQMEDMAKNVEQIIKDLKEFYPDGKPYDTDELGRTLFMKIGDQLREKNENCIDFWHLPAYNPAYKNFVEIKRSEELDEWEEIYSKMHKHRREV